MVAQLLGMTVGTSRNDVCGVACPALWWSVGRGDFVVSVKVSTFEGYSET